MAMHISTLLRMKKRKNNADITDIREEMSVCFAALQFKSIINSYMFMLFS